MSIQADDLKGKYFVLKDTHLIDFPQVQKIIFINNSSESLNNINQRVTEKIKQIHYTGEIGDALKIQSKEAQLIKIYPRSKNEIIKYVKPLKEKKIVVSPAYQIRTLEDISTVASMGLVVDLIALIDSLDFSLTLNILDYYLHNASLNVPIEPFHTILLSKLNHSNQNLWNMNLINPDHFFHCDETGLSESPDGLNDSHYQYLIDHTSKAFKPTNHHSSILSYFNSLPKNRPKCMACNHFHICISWALYKKNSCDKWKECLNILQKASRELQALERFDREHEIIKPGHQ